MGFNIADTDRKRVVIIGGGFGGLKLANRLKGSYFQIVLIDKNNYHQFPPLLYQVASSGLESSSISFPFRKIFQKRKDFYFRLADVKAIVREKNLILTSIGELKYDYLVIASGTVTNFFGNEEIRSQALPMKTIEEALILRNTLLSNFEKATICTDPEEKQALMNIVIVGGGATGVEISGVLAEMKHFVLPKDYPDLKQSKMNIYLVEGSPRLLAAMSEEASGNAKRFLEEMGVKVMLEKKVIDYKGGKVILNDGNTIETKIVVWVSGVTATRFEQIENNELGRGGRILVNAYNQLHGSNNVFAIGDVCLQTETDYPNGHPQVAQVAIQQGLLLADNLKRLEKGEPLKPFHYKNLGTLATVGRNKVVADLHKVKLHGFIAWMVWMGVHLRSILGVKNKIMVLIEWIWSYFTYDQSMRLILFIPKKERNHTE
ncbi:MAG: NAD(P)/FAD-dependent oxidoreductase [Parabacteroides sp.]|nr:NAD(P)/FAD-dependent oxidoreductase [Parabacteroides sp.]